MPIRNIFVQYSYKMVIYINNTTEKAWLTFLIPPLDSRSRVDPRRSKDISFSFWRQLPVSDAATAILTCLQRGSSAHRWRISRWHGLRGLGSPARSSPGNRLLHRQTVSNHGDGRSRRTHRRKTAKKDAEMRDFCIMLIEDIPTISLREMNRLMRATWPHKPAVSESTIARALSGMLISIKLVHDIPVNRNRPDIVEQRKR